MTLADTTALEYNRLPAVVIAVLARDASDFLPTSLACLANLNYDKKRIAFWIATDNNQDQTEEMLVEWKSQVESDYHRVEIMTSNNYSLQTDLSLQWTPSRYRHLLQLRQLALAAALKYWADYVLFVDADNFLTEPDTLIELIKSNRTMVAPLLIESRHSYYSNFWCGVDEQGYYRRTEDYLPTLKRERKGVLQVAMIHSTFLIDLNRKSVEKFSFYPPHSSYQGHIDDLLIFSYSAKMAGIPFHLLNNKIYGYLFSSPQVQELITRRESFLNYKLNQLLDGIQFPRWNLISDPCRQWGKLPFDQVYVINLLRRKERRQYMKALLDEICLDAEFFEAIDGRQLNEEKIAKLGIQILPGYLDPFHQRPMKYGEIGCFLSHYQLWKKVIQFNYSSILILEDDVKVKMGFHRQLSQVMQEVQSLSLPWDIIYIGRKKLLSEAEIPVKGANYLIWPDYSYWTVGYILSASGAKKLLASQPLTHMMAIDEFLPIMYDKHPRKDWKEIFPERNLIAISAEPLLIEPAFYVADKDYVSDTEDSSIVVADQHDEL
ncbi:uncharacterized protein TRIADDRAFT_21834 [Trichoplax adhaerens]|uniref:Glycosyl transferase family 25 domain-containing protein n=1 Tax=Trichoplax adhaerens TaxID=10228 RepID=B3RNT7_TRIAD|nr:hypothetical protein TRIADDRAFT_21834 [Trichoplax adhaerens]EDV27520.1 hypothetical protein TRIADDRAFT_21834 [Trichoplax adhaerens]|eukprot:XP_002109354.1 hypothetical protein TRIADDRAFT_21834 [Trichoplax adhaerens]